MAVCQRLQINHFRISDHSQFFCRKDRERGVKLVGWLVEQGLTSHSTQFRSFWRRCGVKLRCCIAYVKAEKEALKKIPPSDLFRQETDKYSKFDEKVNSCMLIVEFVL